MTLTRFEIESLKVDSWKSINHKFNDARILLGNGFSLNFSETLKYSSLHDHFISNASSASSSLFAEFSTKNFEKVLEHLESTIRVLKALRYEQDEIIKFRNEIRKGLIDSIHRIHPTPDNIDKAKIEFVAKQFNQFSDIYTTNYDLFLYYIIMEIEKFGDYYYFTFFTDDNFQLFNQGDSMNNHHIYYLHGALFLFNNGIYNLKIKKDEEHWLIDKITEQIEKDKYPLFISEGTYESKQESIISDPYLGYCQKMFAHNPNKKSLVVYGQSLSNQDKHIAEIINRNYSDVAVSIKTDQFHSKLELNAEINRLKRILDKSNLHFFDSETLFDFVNKP